MGNADESLSFIGSALLSDLRCEQQLSKLNSLPRGTGGDNMLTVDALKELGADTKDGMARCLNREDFYLRMVKMGIQSDGFEALASAVKAGDLDAAFEAAHALKGVMANLSLTPISKDVGEITELLRSRTLMDYGPLVDELLKKRDRFAALL